MITPSYRSFVKVAEFFQTRYITSNVYPVLNGYCLEFQYQCNDGKRTVCFNSYNENTLYCYDTILRGSTHNFEYLTAFSKKHLYQILSCFPHHATQVIVLGTGVKK